MKLLRIAASSRLADSHSRALADDFVARWQSCHPAGQVVVRDLVKAPIPHISEATIGGFYTPKAEHDNKLQKATALSDELIAELKQADEILIDTPMYNFSIPSALKAWIDQVSRINETFSFDPQTGFNGLLKDKRAWIITASGAVFSSQEMQALDFLTPYLKTLLGFLGISEVEHLILEGTTTDEAAFNASQQSATLQIHNYGSVA